MNDDKPAKDIESLERWMAQANAEIHQLKAENLELKLKVQNLEYFISTITTRRPSEKTFSKSSL